MSRKMFVSLLVLVGMALQALAVSVTFQVNMRVQRQSGNFATGDTVVVRGSMNGWSGNANYCVATGGDSIYSTTIDIVEGNIEYKFAIVRPTGDVWEGVNNRQFTVPATGPVTIPAVYFNDQTIIANYNIEVFFRVNMNVQILSGSFNAANDWVVIRGGHAALGNWGGAAARLTEETGNPGIYSAWIQLSNTAISQAIEYKFVYLTGGNPSNETSHWETNENNRSITPNGTEPDILPPTSGNGFHEVMPNPETVYFSNITPQDIITQPVTVYVSFDMRSAYGKLNTSGEYIIDVQSGDTVRQLNNVNLAGFFNNWPWGSFPTSDNGNDNGSNGDLIANDSIWTASHLFATGSPRNFVFKGGINGYDVEANRAENHEVMINDSSNTFRTPEICFGSQGTLYTNWQTLCRSSSVWMSDPDLPNDFSLAQNFPNPFNPSTTIQFSIPNQAEVKFEVFDLTGRSVLSENHGLKNAGTYTLTFNGSALSSGTYFYKISAGPNFAVRQMLLMK